MSQPLSMNSTASQSSSSGWLGNVPCVPKSSSVSTRPRPNSCAQKRLTMTRAVSGLSRSTSQRASPRRSAGHRLGADERPRARPPPRFALLQEVALHQHVRRAALVGRQLLHDRHLRELGPPRLPAPPVRRAAASAKAPRCENVARASADRHRCVPRPACPTAARTSLGTCLRPSALASASCFPIRAARSHPAAPRRSAASAAAICGSSRRASSIISGVGASSVGDSSGRSASAV